MMTGLKVNKLYKYYHTQKILPSCIFSQKKGRVTKFMDNSVTYMVSSSELSIREFWIKGYISNRIPYIFHSCLCLISKASCRVLCQDA